jgi:DNA-binding transcriptional MocR family regulator
MAWSDEPIGDTPVLVDIKRESHLPLYTQIANQLRELITAGTLKVGDRLPPNRELAKSLGVNRTTVTTAYAELAADGLLDSRVGSGTYITAVPAGTQTEQIRAPKPPAPMPWDALLTTQSRDNWLNEVARYRSVGSVISLASALPQAELFPLEDLRRCVDHVLRTRGRSLLQLGATSGYEPLQEYIVNQMALTGIAVTADQLLITNGCQQSLDLIRRILVAPGEEVALENPTYPGAVSVFCGSDAKYTSVPVGANGIDLNVLEDILDQRRPKLIYVVPSFQNPTGVTMDLGARRRLIEIALKYRVPIVEDDIYRELRYDGPELPPLKALDEHGMVIYICSFSKVGFPGLRVGWVAAPRIVIDHLNQAKQRCDLHASLLAQAAIHEFARRGLLARHIRRVKRAYRERRDAMLHALERHFPDDSSWSRPEGGMAVWVKLPDSLDPGQLLHHALENGVAFIPGDHFFSSLPHQSFVRLSFTMESPAAIEEAVKRLGSMVKARMSKLRRQGNSERPESLRALV